MLGPALGRCQPRAGATYPTRDMGIGFRVPLEDAAARPGPLSAPNRHDKPFFSCAHQCIFKYGITQHIEGNPTCNECLSPLKM